ncbi:hypothetical protein D3C72_1174940 [compost metagenome]
MAAVPFLAGTLDAAEDWQQPCAVIANTQRRTDEAALREIEKPSFLGGKLFRCCRVACDPRHANAALILVAGGLGCVKQPENAIRRGEENRVLFGMGGVMAQALRWPPMG